MKRTYLIIGLASLSIAYSCNGGSTATTKQEADSSLRANSRSTVNPDTGKKDTLIATEQNTFATKAAIGGMMEVETSARMIKSTENPDIQTLATVILRDHNAANKELIAIAKKMKLLLPTALPEEKTDILAKMAPLKEDEKNQFYADLMVKEHDEAILLFELASQNETGELKAFALKHLPTLKLHRTSAVDVQKIMHSIKGDKGDKPLKISKDRQ